MAKSLELRAGWRCIDLQRLLVAATMAHLSAGKLAERTVATQMMPRFRLTAVLGMMDLLTAVPIVASSHRCRHQ